MLRRRWLALSVRGMLLLVVVVAIPLGMFVRKVHLRQRVLTNLEAAGFTVRFDYECDATGDIIGNESSVPGWLRIRFGDTCFHEITNISGEKLPEPLLDQLLALNELRSMSLADATMSDARLARIAGLSQLQRLELDTASISDHGWIALKRLPMLRCLALDEVRIGPEGLEQIGSLTELIDLRLLYVRLDPRELQSLRHLSQLQSLDFIGLTAPTPADLDLGVTCGAWETDFDDQTLAFLADLKQLRSVVLLGVPILGGSLRHLKNASQLEELDLESCSTFGDAELSYLPPLPALKRLYLTGSGRTGMGLTPQVLARLEARLPASCVVSCPLLRAGNSQPSR